MASKSYQHVIQERQKQLPSEGDGQEPVHHADRAQRQSEFAVSRHGMNQESQHNKHNNPPRGAGKH